MTQQVSSQQAPQPQSRPESQQQTRQAEEGAREQFSTAMKKGGPEAKKEGPDAKGKKEGAGDASTAGHKQGDALDASVFSLLTRREGKGQGGGQGEGKAHGGEEREFGEPGKDMPRGEAILAGLMGGVKEQQAAAPVSGPDTMPRIDSELTGKLVDRILVSAADSKGAPEVRISLREDILPGTEIRIQRQPDGGVAVQFVTNDVRAEQMLASRQLTDLQNVLVQNLQVEVRVTTIRTDGSMSADAGTSGQQGQQGRGGGQDQPQDGRSRQHDLFDGMKDEA